MNAPLTVPKQNYGVCLDAVFDLAVSSPGYNLFRFLVLADVERGKRGLDGVHVHFLPGPRDGFRRERRKYDVDEKLWRLRNLLMPGAYLLPTVSEVHVWHDRAAAWCGWRQGRTGLPSACWPTNYAQFRVAMSSDEVDLPPARDYRMIHDAVRARQNVRRLRPSDWARNIVSRRVGRNTITITLRDDSHDEWRNSNSRAWREFAQIAQENWGYDVITIRRDDPATQQFYGNVDLRAALYEAAGFNLGINHGPWALWHFLESCRYGCIYVSDRYVEHEPHIDDCGFAAGSDMAWAGPCQRTHWGDDSLREILELFDALQSETTPAWELHTS